MGGCRVRREGVEGNRGRKCWRQFQKGTATYQRHQLEVALQGDTSTWFVISTLCFFQSIKEEYHWGTTNEEAFLCDTLPPLESQTQ